VAHIWDDAIGRCIEHKRYPRRNREPFWDYINYTLARELGVFRLGNSNEYSYDQCRSFLLSADTSGALDIIELSFQVIGTHMREATHDVKFAAEVT
jgi:hypothetical protein